MGQGQFAAAAFNPFPVGKKYLVGGGVRDLLMGYAVRDYDYVVVGATEVDMLALGFTPVGRTFPIFLEPETRNEYMLARTMVQDAGHPTGWVQVSQPGTTLLEDLAHRDFTINAMALDEQGCLVDPFGGEQALAQKRLSLVTPMALQQDPLRVLRMCRFLARYPDFVADAGCLEAARQVCASGVLDEVHPVRIWKELSRGLMETKPARMINSMREVGALKALMPALDNLWGVEQNPVHHPEVDCFIHSILALEQAVLEGASLDVRFACLVHDLGKGLTPVEILPAHHGHEEAGVPLIEALCARVGAPFSATKLAVAVARYHTHVHGIRSARHASVVKLLVAFRATKQAAFLEDVVLACQCDARGRTGRENAPYPQADYLREAQIRVSQLDLAPVVAANKKPDMLAQQIHAARVASLVGMTRTPQGVR